MRVQVEEQSAVDVGDGCLTFVRIDPARMRLRLRLGALEGGAKRADEWAASEVAGAINAGMFHADGRPIGIMIDGERVGAAKDNAMLGGFFAFDPVREGLPRVAAFGRDCPGFDLAALKRDYRVVVQNYRLLDCGGQPIPWQDQKSYSAAAIGVDRAGWAVFVHTRTPYTMTTLARLLADEGPALVAAHFVEGGPEASLFVRAGAHQVSAVGSFESGFLEADSNQQFWPLPNVISFEARGP